MRFLILNTDYSVFLDWLYAQHQGLEEAPYEEQHRLRVQSMHGVTAFFPDYLQRMGHQGWHIWFNNEAMQRCWAQERSVKVAPRKRWRFWLRRGIVPWVCYGESGDWVHDVLRAQIEAYRPDVIFNCNIRLDTSFLRAMRPHYRLLAGMHASPMPGPDVDLGIYDLIISSLPNLVHQFRQMGVRSRHVAWGFEPAVLEQVGEGPRDIGVSFVGSLQPAHSERRSWLEEVCRRVDVDVWAPRSSDLPPGSACARRYHGEAWARDMYSVLGRSRISLNHHIDVAGDYANNIRLFQVTGMGALLVTDWKTNLEELFEAEREAVAYRSAEECAEKVRYCLEHEGERKAIASAGQQRALRDHRLEDRLGEIVRLIEEL